jgi:hypothetical protein
LTHWNYNNNNMESIGPNKRARRVPDASKDYSDTMDDDSKRANMAYRWWNDHLKRSHWIHFTPKKQYCNLSGFIPVQYATGMENRKSVAHVLKHGKRGKHYAIGWVDLYYLVKTFGELGSDNGTWRPGMHRHQIILDYEGPPLQELAEQQQEPSRQRNRTKKNSSQNKKSIQNNAPAPPSGRSSGSTANKKRSVSDDKENDTDAERQAIAEDEKMCAEAERQAIAAFMEGYLEACHGRSSSINSGNH